MKKLFFTILVMGVVFIFADCYSQIYTPPKIVLGLSLNGYFATNDAYGTGGGFTVPNDRTYGMMWGRGASLYAKFGLGERKRHRIVTSLEYNHMTNDNRQNKIPFFVFNPRTLNTVYDIYSLGAGYEFCFNARCERKQTVGIGFTGNMIAPGSGSSTSFDHALRLGMYVNAAYEFVLDKKFKYGLSFGIKYHLVNVLGTENGPNKP